MIHRFGGRQVLVGLGVVVMGMVLASTLRAVVVTKSHSLSVLCSAPPAAMFLEDSQGRRSGADPAEAIGTAGQGKEINEIPNTIVDLQWVWNEGTNKPSDTAGWLVIVSDGPGGTYKVHLVPIADGISVVNISAYDTNGKGPSERLLIPMKKGIDRELTIAFEPENDLLLRVDRPSTGDDVVWSVKLMCKLGTIKNEGICQSLLAKANASAASIERGNKQAAQNELRALMREVKAQRGKQIADSAADVLLGEAEALLKSLGGGSGEAQESTRPKRWWWPFAWFGS